MDEGLTDLCDELGIHLSKDEKRLNIRPLLRLVLGRFFGSLNGQWMLLDSS